MSKFVPLFLSILFLSTLISCGSKWIDATRFSSALTSAPVSGGSSIYALSQDGILYSVSSSDGTTSVLRSLNSPSHIPIQKGRTSIFVATDSSKIFALSLRTSENIWQYPQAPSKPASNSSSQNLTLRSIQYYDGVLYAVFKTRLIAFSESTGAVVFEKSLTDGTCISASSTGLYISDADKVMALSKDGRVRWSVSTGNLYNACATPLSNNVYVPTTRGTLLSLDATTGQLKWFYPISGWAMSNPVSDGSSVLFGGSDGFVRSLNSQTGKLNYKTQINGEVWANPVMLEKDGKKIVIFGTRNSSIVAIEPSSGKILFDYQVSDWVDSVSISDDGRTILASTRDNSLWAIIAYPLCTIDYPRTNQIIPQELTIRGRTFSFSGVKSVQLTVNSKSYPSITLAPDSTFEYEVDLSKEPLNVVDIQCAAIDSQGILETDRRAYKTQPILSLAASKLNLSIQVYPSSPKPGEKFDVYIRNSQGFDVSGALLEYQGKNISVSSPYKLTAPASGTYTITARKSGYYPAQAQFSIRQEMGILPIALLVVFILAIFGGAVFLLKKKKINLS